MKNKETMDTAKGFTMQKLAGWAKEYLGPDYKKVNLLFNASVDMGCGLTKYKLYPSAELHIGVSPLSASFLNRHMPINKDAFVRIGTTIFHELAHYKHTTSDKTPKEVLISDLSKCGNAAYYKRVWSTLPHEINAEYSGIMSMWSALEANYPKEAEELMLDHLIFKTTNTKYIFKMPDDGFKSKAHVKDLFNGAYEMSLTGKRKLPDNFLRMDIDIIKLISNNGYSIDPEYESFYNQISKAQTGAELDKMMASLVTHLYPELQEFYPQLDFKELDSSAVFGMPMPETTEESRARLGIKPLYDDFSAAVGSITKSIDNNQYL